MTGCDLRAGLVGLCRTAGIACGNAIGMALLGLNPPGAGLTCQSGVCCLPPGWLPPLDGENGALAACAELSRGDACAYGDSIRYPGECTAQPSGLTCMPTTMCAGTP